MKIAVLVGFMSFFVNAWAGPDQLEVIGLVPGETTRAQIETIDKLNGFVIGGYKLLCLPEYIDDILSQLFCLTGKESFSIDITDDSQRIASNIEVHEALLEGFTKKFGLPAKAENSILQNRLGATLQSHVAVWVDKAGNNLTIISRDRKIDEGLLMLVSAQKINNNKAEKQITDQKRKF